MQMGSPEDWQRYVRYIVENLVCAGLVGVEGRYPYLRLHRS